MAGILFFSDKENLARELLSAARQVSQAIGSKACALCINNENMAGDLAGRGAVVYAVNNQEIKLEDTVSLASVLKQAAEKLGTSIVLLSSNRRGKEVAGRLAQMLGAGCLSDVTSLKTNEEGKIECTRNALGGATVAVQAVKTEKKVLAVAPRSFAEAEKMQGGRAEPLEVGAVPSTVRLIKKEKKKGDTVDIETAEVLVAVGMGATGEDFFNAQKAAQLLGGEIACSKPVATDRKWLPEERLIGLSGKKCKPELAILLGISGQVQFVVGIRDARTIVAVNTDENANIMNMADYFMVADIKEVLPEFIQILSSRMN